MAPLDTWGDGGEPGTSPRVPALFPRSNPVCTVKAVLLVFLFPVNYFEPLDKQGRELSRVSGPEPQVEKSESLSPARCGSRGSLTTPPEPRCPFRRELGSCQSEMYWGLLVFKAKGWFPCCFSELAFGQDQGVVVKRSCMYFLAWKTWIGLFSLSSHWLGAGVPPGRGRCGFCPSWSSACEPGGPGSQWKDSVCQVR